MSREPGRGPLAPPRLVRAGGPRLRAPSMAGTAGRTRREYSSPRPTFRPPPPPLSQNPALRVASPAYNQRMADTSSELIGGRSRVLANLGKGAMGLVFMAHDPVLDREVAIRQMTAEVVARARTTTASGR